MSMPDVTPQPDETFDYNDRYGITPRKSWVAPAAVFAVLGLSWTLWAALNNAQPELRSTLYSFEVTGEREITMKYAIDRRDPDAIVLCTLITLDIDKNIVGEFADQIPATTTSIITRKTRVLARSIPVNAAVIRCATT